MADRTGQFGEIACQSRVVAWDLKGTCEAAVQRNHAVVYHSMGQQLAIRWHLLRLLRQRGNPLGGTPQRIGHVFGQVFQQDDFQQG